MNINFYGPINPTGYGVASFNILKSLGKNNDISYFPKGQPSVDTAEDYELIISMINRHDFDINAPCIKIWHQFDLAERVGRGPYFAYPFFELDTFSILEQQHMKVPDGLFVSSHWAKDVVSKNNIDTPTHVIPLGVNIDIFDHNKFAPPTMDKYVFINIGKWEIRKGHDILIDIFRKAFPTENDVELWVIASEHTNSYSNKEQLIEWKQKYSIDNRVKLSSGVNTQHELAHIISQANCGIFMSRAEGWNLELLECMAMNKPTIATNYSAHTEFCTNDNSYLVDIESTEKAIDNKAFVGQGSWAKIEQKQIDQCIEYMRMVYHNQIRSNIAGLNTAKSLSWNNSANKIQRCISEI
jgi:glycosyltransferase involved in cell wall biosynthesis